MLEEENLCDSFPNSELKHKILKGSSEKISNCSLHKLNLNVMNFECRTISLNPMNPINNIKVNNSNFNNCNNINSNNEIENDNYYKNLMSDFNLDHLNENFSSRDLAKIFIYLVKNKIRDENNDLSMKGIKYWDSLSKNPRFDFLFQRYKPWTLHTSFKRLFTNSNIDEVTKLMLDNPTADLSWLLKNLYTSKKKKEKVHHKKFLQKKVKRNTEYESSESYESEKENSINIVIDKDSEKYEDEFEEESLLYGINKYQNKNFSKNNSILIDENSIPRNKFYEYFSKKTAFKHSELIFNLKNNSINIKDSLSDLYDNQNNLFANKILTVDFQKYKTLFYLTVSNNNEGSIRKFNNKSINTCGKDDIILKRNKILEIINTIKNEFKIENENHIIEVMMRLSNNEEDLKLYFSDPLKYQGN